MTEYRKYTKLELAVNVRNQYLDKLVRLEIDKKYYQNRIKMAKPNSQEKKSFNGFIKLIGRKIEEAQTRIAAAEERIKELE